MNKRVWYIKNKDHNGVKQPGERITMNFVARGNAKSAAVTSISDDPNALVLASWHNGFEGYINAPVTKNHKEWTLALTFDKPIDRLEIWDADVVRSEQNGKVWYIKNKAHNGVKQPGDHIKMNFLAWGGAKSATVTGPTGATTSLNTASVYDYDEVLRKSILFYESQRSGKLPSTNRISWRGNSALGDRGKNREDLTGGWYDGGDHMKFGLPMAWSATTLLWGLVDYKAAYVNSGEYENMLNCVKWPLDYFLKTHTATNELYVQSGDISADHAFWGRPEDLNMYRPSYKVDVSNPGSDVAGETAAALAAGSIAFKSKVADSSKLLAHAKELYNFGSSYLGKYTTDGHIPANPLYTSSGYTDDLCVAAAWLYRATNEQKYLSDAKKWAANKMSWAWSWDDNTVACQLLLYILTNETTYKQDVETYMSSWLPGDSVPYTPKGLAWRGEKGPLRYAANSAFLALRAADAGIQSDKYRTWAKYQIHYMLGDAGRSYVVGFGNNPPTHPHHRAASCPLRPGPCGKSNKDTPSPNPQVLTGALVGGPGKNDDYADVRTDAVKNAVRIDYNAGFQSAVAALKQWTLDLLPPDQGSGQGF
ncbi:uncharacterized protein LOC106161500 [Lingula anatina]|uniref:cellulase n=1 Tax=Lingula anatina TaxID=7574 RepID=A0A1S3I7T3_LINAN|nr:uncharacterized protein LOC106161500 [Lingula anatina]|eukprot:XP_013393921.1 uncharacterized protein LOC106161500 [Lingula anatina]